MDINAIKSKLATLQSTSNTKDNFWKPEPGQQVVRIVPYKHNKDNPFIELFFHYNLGNNKTYLSPLSFGRPDPVAEFADKLKSTGNKDEWIQGKRLEPKMRTFAPVVVRGKESEGVKFWGFGKTIYAELLSIISDPDYGDITDLMNGRDIDVEFTPAEAQGQYPKTTIRVKPNTSAATEDKDIAKSIMNQPKITDIFPEPTYDELETALQEWMNPENADADVQATTTETKTEEVKETVESKTNVADAFNDLFNQ